MSETVHISATIKTAIRDGVLAIAKADHERPFSQMVNILLDEAIKARKEQSKTEK